MLITPLGKIVIIKNGIEINYTPIKFKPDLNALKDKPFNDIYRITVQIQPHDTISCKLVPNEVLESYVASGEDLACIIITKDKTELAIGGLDEIYNFECSYLKFGLMYENIESSVQKKEVVFGISWVTDAYKGDIRTWFASDPSMD